MYVKSCPDGKGDGVFSGTLPISKGSVVCDYHGADRSKQEGESVMRQTEGAAGNYVFFYQLPGKGKQCKDACSGCGCHTKIDFERTVGRMINHSRKHANLKASFRSIDGAACILMVAQEQIAPKTELTFDYGVRRAEDGSQLDWLNT